MKIYFDFSRAFCRFASLPITSNGTHNMTTEQQIASDLNTISLIMAIGSKSAKRKAAKHRAACFAEIKKMNEADNLSDITDDELLSELLG